MGVPKQNVLYIIILSMFAINIILIIFHNQESSHVDINKEIHARLDYLPNVIQYTKNTSYTFNTKDIVVAVHISTIPKMYMVMATWGQHFQNIIYFSGHVKHHLIDMAVDNKQTNAAKKTKDLFKYLYERFPGATWCI